MNQRSFVFVRCTDERYEKSLQSVDMYFALPVPMSRRAKEPLEPRVFYYKGTRFESYGRSYSLNARKNLVLLILLMRLH